MKYFYSAAVMGYGFGRPWHHKYNFPALPRVTQTLTYTRNKGCKFAVIPFGKSIWNKVGLHNIGLGAWIQLYYNLHKDMFNLKDLIISFTGNPSDIYNAMEIINNNYDFFNIGGIELNFSCPNIHKGLYNYEIPSIMSKLKFPVYLKLRYDEDPYKHDLTHIAGIRLNSVPFMGGGISGKMAQEKNWSFIKQFGKELNVAGCSITCYSDIKKLEDMGCKEIGLGSIVLTDPHFVEKLGPRKYYERIMEGCGG